MEPIKTRMRVVAEIKSKIAMAVRRIVRATYQAGPLYAELIKLVIVAEKKGLSRSTIAKAIKAEHEAERSRRLVRHTTGKTEEVTKVNKGSVSRYVILARYAQGKFRRDENHVESVTIDGHEYKSPITALESGHFSFRKVYLAWRDAVNPAVTDLSEIPTSPQESAERIVKRLTLPLLVKGDDGAERVQRVKVTESAEGLAALLDLLHALPNAKEAERLREVREVVRRPQERAKK